MARGYQKKGAYVIPVAGAWLPKIGCVCTGSLLLFFDYDINYRCYIYTALDLRHLTKSAVRPSQQALRWPLCRPCIGLLFFSWCTELANIRVPL